MKHSAPQLNKEEIRAMVKSPKADGKSHMVQIYDIKVSDSGGKQRMSVKISDGCYYIRAIAGHVADIKDFDTVGITSYKVTEVKTNTIMVIEKMERIYTNLTSLIGAPVDFKTENKASSTIVTVIPNTAKLIGGASPKQDTAKPAAAPKPVSPPPQKQPSKKPESKVSLGDLPGIKPIKALGLYSSDWTIKVRLLKKGEQKKFTREKVGESFLVPLEFIDEEGTQITATLFGAGIEKYTSILIPMQCYLISNGSVKMANKKFTSIKTDCSLSLDATCSISEVAEDSNIPKSGFSFTPISKIAELPNFTVIDILGIVKTVGDMAPFSRKDGTTTMRRVISLYDESDHSIEVTLWASYAEGEFKEGEILGFKGVKVSEYNGKQLNTINDTTVVRDCDNPKMNALKELY